MSEHASSFADRRRVRFSLLQLVAIITSVGAAIALSYLLSNPPLGSIGIAEASLPAIVLLVSLWFCSIDLIVRLGTYAVVASLLTIYFFLSSIGDWLFGHTRGPPQFTMAACVAGLIAVCTGMGWLIVNVNRYLVRRAAAGKVSPPRVFVGWLGGCSVVLLTALGGLAGWAAFTELPLAERDVDNYLTRQQLRAKRFAGMHARASDRAREEKKRQLRSALLRDMAGADEVARYRAATTLILDNVSEDREHRMNAVKILGSPPAGADVDKGVHGLLRVLSDAPREDPSRREAIRSLGEMGPAAVPAVPRLGLMVFAESTDANERAEAIASLAAMGPAAKGEAHRIGRAWQLGRISTEQSQLLYQIDPDAAEKLGIPRPEGRVQ